MPRIRRSKRIMRQKLYNSEDKQRTQHKQYSLQNLSIALYNNIYLQQSVNSVSSSYKIPRTTIYDWLQKILIIQPLPSTISDNQTFITNNQFEKKHHNVTSKEIDTQLVNWIVMMNEICQSVGKRIIKDKLLQIMRIHNIPRNTIGKNWFHRFVTNHPELSLRKSESQTRRSSSALTQHNIDSLFNLLHQQVTKLNLQPNQIFAMDETGFSGDFRNCEKVLIPRKGKYSKTLHSGYTGHMSLLHIGCANGESLPPIFIFNGKQIKEGILSEAPSRSTVMLTKNGSFEKSTFFNCIKHICDNIQITPIILIMDGHSSHFSVEGLELAKRNNIFILCLQPILLTFYNHLTFPCLNH